VRSPYGLLASNKFLESLESLCRIPLSWLPNWKSLYSSHWTEGLKVHQTAAPTAIAAAKRLHAKGLIDQPDGGYLTSLGRDAAEQAQTLLTILTTATTKEAA